MAALLLHAYAVSHLPAPHISVRVYVRHFGEVREYRPADSVVPGDAIAFAVGPPGCGTNAPDLYVVLLGHDGRGETVLYYPEGPRAVLASTSQPSLPFSLLLDDAPGPETFDIVACRDPVLVDSVRVAMIEPGQRLPRGCVQERVVLEKRLTQ